MHIVITIIIITIIIIIIIITIVIRNADLIQSFVKFLPDTSVRWRMACLTTYGAGLLEVAVCLLTLRAPLAVLVRNYLYISFSDNLRGTWLIFIMRRAPIIIETALVLNFHIFVTSIWRYLYLESAWNSLREILLSYETVTSFMIQVFAFEFFIVMSGRFASIYLFVLIMKSHRVFTSVLFVASCGLCSCYFSVWGNFKFCKQDPLYDELMMNCFCGIRGERCLALYPAGTIVKVPHHCKSPTRCEQDLNLCRSWVQACLKEVVQSRLIEWSFRTS